MSFEELLLDLQGQRTIQEDPNHISLGKLFNETFMSKHSPFTSFDEFLEKGKFQAKTHDDLNNIVGELFDRHIARETDFADWASMLAAANKEYEAK
ncbi:hypothetical protein [Cohnella sp. AR92]|uniref:hypothetical protein n=1 Tax=Cohnella sp. AR92 TaxID=648716 RepID=UPI000F8CCFD9|nr:hypothetical protein [Cohnella sp. AR92]RUS42671.1 hypothetical protein ELR57_26280 [Cohnella sp. AR92]